MLNSAPHYPGTDTIANPVADRAMSAPCRQPRRCSHRREAAHPVVSHAAVRTDAIAATSIVTTPLVAQTRWRPYRTGAKNPAMTAERARIGIIGFGYIGS